MTMKEQEEEEKKKNPLDVFKERVEERISTLKKNPEPVEKVVHIEKENITNMEEVSQQKVEIYHEPNYDEPVEPQITKSPGVTVKTIEPKYDYEAAFAFREKESAPYEIPTFKDKK